MYTVEDFLNRTICVQCDTIEQRDQLREMAGWEGQYDAFGCVKTPAIFYHRRHDGKCYGHTTYTDIGSNGIEHAHNEWLEIVPFDDLVAPSCVFDAGMFNQMLGIKRE